MKPFDSLAPHATPPTTRAPATLQGFEMLPKGMTPGAGVWSAAPGMKSYEIPPAARSAVGALGERANRGAKSSGGCGCGGGCGPCGGAKASLMGGASGTGGAGAVMRAPAALRGFEMLPQGMKPVGSVSSATAGMRSYEIPPNAKLAGQGLMGALRAPKAYEIMPGAGVATKGLGRVTFGVQGESKQHNSPRLADRRRIGTPDTIAAKGQPLRYPMPVLGCGKVQQQCEDLQRNVNRYILDMARAALDAELATGCLDPNNSHIPTEPCIGILAAQERNREESGVMLGRCAREGARSYACIRLMQLQTEFTELDMAYHACHDTRGDPDRVHTSGWAEECAQRQLSADIAEAQYEFLRSWWRAYVWQTEQYVAELGSGCCAINYDLPIL